MWLARRGERDLVLPQLPGRLTGIIQIGKLLLLLESVHAPEPVVAVPEQLALRDEPVEGRIDELVARPDVVEDLAAQAEESGVDDHVGFAHRTDRPHFAVALDVDEVEAL